MMGAFGALQHVYWALLNPVPGGNIKGTITGPGDA
jgi:hypothetical protein